MHFFVCDYITLFKFTIILSIEYTFYFEFCFTVMFQCFFADSGPVLFDIIWLCSYLIGQFTILFIFTMRLEATFVDSLKIFAISPQQLTILYGFIIFDCIVFIVLMSLLMFGLVHFVVPVAQFVVFSFLILYSILIYIYFTKTVKVMTYKIESINNNIINNNNNNNNINNNQVFVDISSVSIEILIGYLICLFCGFTSTVLTMAFSAILFAFSSNTILGRASFPEILVSIDSTANMIVICFLFGFSRKWYEKICCYFDKWGKNILINKLMKKHSNATNLQTKEQFVSLLLP